jgi:hypothetical protein
MKVKWTDFGEVPLHDKVIRVVDIELHTLEDCLDDVLLSFMTAEEVFGDIWKGDLKGRCSMTE